MTTEQKLKVARKELQIFQDFHRDIANAAYQKDMIVEAQRRLERRCADIVRAVQAGRGY